MPTPNISDFIPSSGSRPQRATAKEGKEKSEESEERVEAMSPASPETSSSSDAEKRAKRYEELVDKLSPVELYQKRLDEADISNAMAMAIVDALMSQGFYEETVHLTKRTSVTFRTRRHSDTLRLQHSLEIQRPIYNEAVEEMAVRYNIASSLIRFHDTTLSFPGQSATAEDVEEAFDKRLKFVEALPDQTFYRLASLMASFDEKVMLVMSEGVAENF